MSSSSSSVKRNIDLSLINDHIKNILVTISQNPVTNVVAPVGAGKTTKLPIGIAESDNRITVVVANDGIAKSLVGYVSALTDISVSNELLSSNQIKYVSESTIKDHLYQMIKKGGRLDFNFTDVLMIDQSDRGSIDQDLIIAIWKYCSGMNVRIPRLLLISNMPLVINNIDMEVYIIEDSYYPVEIRYYNRDYPLSPYQTNTEQTNRENLVDNVIKLVYDLHISNIEGDILIFTSGKLQLDDMVDKLENINIENAEILPVHQDLTKEEIDKIYSKTTKRKIIVSDNSAETSFTIDYLGAIIDLMIEYRKELSLTGGQRYPKKYISQERANLRSKRGGKYLPTICYRMITSSSFNLLPTNNKREIYCVPLHWLILDLTQNQINIFKVLDMFDISLLEKMYKLIIRLRLIDITGRITKAGEFSLTIPYGIRQAAALYQWLEKEYPPYPAIVLLSLIDAYKQSYYVYPLLDKGVTHAEYNLELLEHRKTYFEPFVSKSDLHTYGTMWTIMMEEVGGPEVPSTDIHDWCKNNYISYTNISEAMFLNKSVLDIIKTVSSGQIEIGPFNSDNLLDLLGPILKDIYVDRQLNFDSSNNENNNNRIRYVDTDGKYYKVDSINGINTIDMDTPSIIYGLITSTISSKYSSDFDTIICSLV